MNPYYADASAQLYHGDALAVLRELPDASVDAVVTDPPAGIGFMGKEWDDFRRARNGADAERDNVFGRTSARGPEYARRPREAFIAFLTAVMAECLRVLKPGGHALVWAIPRTSHWTATACEDAGFEIRDRIAHVFGSGFPKSLDVGKAIDKAAGAERELVTTRALTGKARVLKGGNFNGEYVGQGLTNEYLVTAPATDAAKQWNGWGTALKPAMEDWWLCRKPVIGTVAENVQQYGTGALNIDGCRIESAEHWDGGGPTKPRERGIGYASSSSSSSHELGRWPAHLTHDGSDEVLALFPQTDAGEHPARGGKGGISTTGHRGYERQEARSTDAGSAARFFYCAKASRDERGRGNDHPTVKPHALMRWLCRLITPPGGLVLDPFMGSGSTIWAAKEEGFRAIGIDQEERYVEIAAKRLAQEVLPFTQVSTEVHA